jgi:hypothetical protein
MDRHLERVVGVQITKKVRRIGLCQANRRPASRGGRSAAEALGGKTVARTTAAENA